MTASSSNINTDLLAAPIPDITIDKRKHPSEYAEALQLKIQAVSARLALMQEFWEHMEMPQEAAALEHFLFSPIHTLLL